MCGRYALFTPEQVPDRFNVDGAGLGVDFQAHYNITPGSVQPVITRRRGQLRAESMKWGYQPPWSRQEGIIYRYKTFNARSEGVFDKPMWKQLIRYRRCLVPANGFYEWQDVSGGKQPYFIRPADESLFAFAGIYGFYRDEAGRERGSFAILTTQANDSMKSLHDRMPVILHRDMEMAWVDEIMDEPEAIKVILKPYSRNLRIVRVSQDVNTAQFDGPRLIEPIKAK